jgi:hypothetical protein
MPEGLERPQASMMLKKSVITIRKFLVQLFDLLSEGCCIGQVMDED